MAQPIDPQSLIDASGGANDYSVQILSYVFGTPLSALGITGSTAGPGAVFFDQFFLTLNAALFGLGVFWFAFSVMSATVHTANEGQFLGKRYSSFWFTIRGIVGFSSLVPVFNGWSLVQLSMYAMTIMGIGLANLLLGGFGATGLTSALDGTLQPRSQYAEQMVLGSTPPSTESVRMVQTMLTGQMCAVARNNAIQTEGSLREGMEGEAITCRMTRTGGATNENKLDYRCGKVISQAPGLDRACGGFEIEIPTSASSGGAPRGYVDTQSMNNARTMVLSEISTQMQSLATEAISEHKRGTAGTLDFQNEIKKAAKKYDTAVATEALAQLPNARRGANEALMTATAHGWIGLGTSFHQVSKQMADVGTSLSARPNIVEPSAPEGEFDDEDYSEVIDRYKASETPEGGAAASGMVSKLFVGLTDGTLNLITGLTGDGTRVNVSNPIVYSQQLGDYIMLAGEGALFSWAVASAVPAAATQASNTVSNSFGGVAAVPASLAAGISQFAKTLTEVLGPLIMMGLLALFFFGIMLSVYIPLVPFITWWSAVIQWFVVVAESIVAAPLLAFAHLDADGEGLGQRTQYGYVFAINVLLRPALMVISFVFATVACIILGTILLELFKAVVPASNAQSLIGPIKFFSLIAVFMSLTLALVHTCFGMTSVITDQTLAWIGGHANSALGARHDQEASNVVVAGVGHGRMAMGQGVGKMASATGGAAAGPSAGGVVGGGGNGGPKI